MTDQHTHKQSDINDLVRTLAKKQDVLPSMRGNAGKLLQVSKDEKRFEYAVIKIPPKLVVFNPLLMQYRTEVKA